MLCRQCSLSYSIRLKHTHIVFELYACFCLSRTRFLINIIKLCEDEKLRDRTRISDDPLAEEMVRRMARIFFHQIDDNWNLNKQVTMLADQQNRFIAKMT